MRPIHVLSIGNSFSRDAHTYLHDYADSQGVDIQTLNLYIPGCSLERHYQNLLSGEPQYTPEINGHAQDGVSVSIQEAVKQRDWDFITLQQVSLESYKEDSFYPYISCLAEYVRQHCPKAKLLIHQTWGYESHSKRILDHGFETYEEMFSHVKPCYDKAAKQIGADGIIPSGEAFLHGFRNGLKTLHRDTFHASYGIGRMLLAMVWYGVLTGNAARIPNDFPAAETISGEEYRIAAQTANQVLQQIER